MTMRHGDAILATLFSLLLPMTASTPERALAQETGFQVGEPFPTIAFPALEDGRPRSITDFRGQKLILHVFASW